MNRITVTLTMAAGLCLAGRADAQHAGDVFLEGVAGRILTGSITERTILHDHRVFPAEFGEIFRNFTDEPGFDSRADAFAPGTNIGFNVLDAVRIWNGRSFATRSPVTFTISFANLNVETGAGFVEGFGLPVAPNGEWHRHLNFVINDPAPAGIYLLALELWSDDPGLRNSDPFFIVFNQESSELLHDEAIDWVEKNLVAGIRFEDVDLGVGRVNDFRVRGATPGRRVTFFYGFRLGGGPQVPGCPGTWITIHFPRVMGSAIVDSSGRATYSQFVPGGARGRIVFFGAVEPSTCTVGNVVEHEFE